MAKLITEPQIIKAEGNKPKLIEEFIGAVCTQNKDVSIARMKSPEGWAEPGQTPEFDEFTVVLIGTLVAETKDKKFEIKESQAFHAYKNEWVRYSTPYSGGAEYMAICLPAFSPNNVHRDK